jgi:hypothetical protein
MPPLNHADMKWWGYAQEPAASSPVASILSRLGKDVYEVLHGLQTARGDIPAGELKVGSPDALAGADMLQKSIDFRFSEVPSHTTPRKTTHLLLFHVTTRY